MWLNRPLKERLALFVGTWRVGTLPFPAWEKTWNSRPDVRMPIGESSRPSDKLSALDTWLPVGFKHDFYVVGLQVNEIIYLLSAPADG